MISFLNKPVISILLLFLKKIHNATLKERYWLTYLKYSSNENETI